ncbi:MAG: hypothetical protein GY804_02940 [Alphaproteobacteria bacterium]|nr:hypothetical protein [Alphaproteobacteria bacterium]
MIKQELTREQKQAIIDHHEGVLEVAPFEVEVRDFKNVKGENIILCRIERKDGYASFHGVGGKGISGGWKYCRLPQEATVKPPLGIMPRKLWYENRAQELRDCIKRYDKANKYTTALHIELEEVEEYIEANGLKEEESTTRPMTAQEIAMLPRGTAFVYKDTESQKKAVVYNPFVSYGARVLEVGNMTLINSSSLADFDGYQLPNEEEVRAFTVEVKG